MEPSRRTLSSLRRHAQNWRRSYESVLQETEKNALFKCVEAAEAAILTRQEALEYSADHHGERQAMEQALAHLRFLKSTRLGFGRIEDQPANRISDKESLLDIPSKMQASRP